MAQAQSAFPPAQSFQNVRRWPRLKIRVPVTVVLRKQEKTVFVQGRGQDLNEGGIAVFVGAELRLGDIVEISFTPPYQGNPMMARALVRNRRGYTYGMEFVGETPADHARIASIRAVLQTMQIN
jgi:hypothetical protein